MSPEVVAAQEAQDYEAQQAICVAARGVDFGNDLRNLLLEGNYTGRKRQCTSVKGFKTRIDTGFLIRASRRE